MGLEPRVVVTRGKVGAARFNRPTDLREVGRSPLRRWLKTRGAANCAKRDANAQGPRKETTPLGIR